MKMQAREIAGHLTKRAIAAELPWSIGQRELIVLRAQDFNTYVKESYVERPSDIPGEFIWVKQRDFSRIAVSAADLVLSEAAFFERLNWHKASFYGLDLPNGANRPVKKDWSKEEVKRIQYIASYLRAGAESLLGPVNPDIMLAARHLNAKRRAKIAKAKRAKSELSKVELMLLMSATPERKQTIPLTLRVYENDNNPYSDLPL